MLYLVNKKHKSVQNSYKNLSKKKIKKMEKKFKTMCQCSSSV